MAKSLRSKWRRKCRAVKRIRYGQKELERLKKTLGIDDTKDAKTLDVSMSEVNELVTITDANTIKKKKNVEEGKMTMDIDGKQRVFNLKTMKDQNGSAPAWLHQRKIKKMKKKEKGKNKKRKF